MKLITAIIGVFKLDAVCKSLEDIHACAVTITPVTGTGRQLSSVEFLRGIESKPHGLPKVKLDIAVPDVSCDAVIDAIRRSAYTGRVGDGKIFVSRIEEAIRIRDGRRGDAALGHL